MNRTLFAVLAVLVVAVGCMCASPSGSDTTKAPPVINWFGAKQENGHYILRWDVSGAEKANISQGIGKVASSGTKQISPRAPTQYILTATNKAGSTSAFVYVEGVAEPDLVIMDISQYEEPDGFVISYTIDNRGGADAGPSNTKLYIDGEYKDKDVLDSIAAGSSVIGQFKGWVPHSSTKAVVKVIADADNDVEEMNEENNAKETSLSATVAYDFIERAPFAIWKSGPPTSSLLFGGEPIDQQGSASYTQSRKLEDGTGPLKVLHTRPMWIDNGWIQGTYQEMWTGMYRGKYTVKPGDSFFARVCLLEGAENGNVKFRVMILPDGGPDTWIAEVNKSYTGSVNTINVPLNSWVGKRAYFILEVQTNESPQQDWASWIEAKIIRK